MSYEYWNRGGLGIRYVGPDFPDAFPISDRVRKVLEEIPVWPDWILRLYRLHSLCVVDDGVEYRWQW